MLESPSPTAPAADASADIALNGSPRRRFARGFRLGVPILLGYLPVGVAFGILARTAGFSVFAATACSATALAGAGQFIGLSLVSGGAGVAAALTATTVVNLRYVLFGTTLTPYLRSVGMGPLAWLAFTLTDETFAVNIADRRQGLATVASMAGVGAVAWVGWVAGTAIGAVGAAWIGDPGRWGVAFAMPAMFTALFVALAEDRRHALTGALAGAIALGLPVLRGVGIALPSSWFIVIASMAAATIASAVYRADT